MHVVLIVGGVASHLGAVPELVSEVRAGMAQGTSKYGAMGLALLFLRAYSLGGGTYTGIEAVSNGLQIMREPRVQTGKRTMVYMALSLALTAGGILIGYLLLNTHHVEGKTMNAILAENVFGTWSVAGMP